MSFDRFPVFLSWRFAYLRIDCILMLFLIKIAGWSSPAARQAHNLKVVGSNPTPATKIMIAGWSSPAARQAHNLKVVGSNPTPATNMKLRNSNELRSFFVFRRSLFLDAPHYNDNHGYDFSTSIFHLIFLKNYQCDSITHCHPSTCYIKETSKSHNLSL